MAMADVVHDAPDSAPHGIEEFRTPKNVGFKSESTQEKGILENKNAEAGPLNRSDGGCDEDTGYILSGSGWEDKKDGRNLYQGMAAENRQHNMYHGPTYGCQSPSYITQPQEHYMSNMGSRMPGYGQQYLRYYGQAPSSTIQYYPIELDGPKKSIKKQTTNKEGRNPKAKSVGNDRQGYHAGLRSSVPLDGSNQWGLYPVSANGNLCGSSNGYELYSQQWHSSAQGFQPIPPPQNMGVRGIYIPVLPGQYQNIPWVHSAPSIYAKEFKVNSLKGLSGGANWRARDSSKVPNKLEDSVNTASNDAVEDQNQFSSIKVCKVHPATTQEHEAPTMQENSMTKNHVCPINREDFNKENFQISYEKAKFFVIKSYSEDDVHKSIKYGVWSSTPSGNKCLDDAYKKAQEQSQPFSAIPIFLFFSVNSSGQFCGVAEMLGPVDFNKNMDFWLQGKWNGSFSVRWHIIKDVPNGHFRHIILSNNEHKPVTHSRDTQEVHFHQGLEMLKIFKSFQMRTSLLDDFAFYDGRQKLLQERKLKQQQQQQHQMAKQFKERIAGKAPITASNVLSDNKENGGIPLGSGASTVKSIESQIVELKVEEETIPESMNAGKDIIVYTKEEHLDDKSTKKEGTRLDPSPKEGAIEEVSQVSSNYKKALLGVVPFVHDQSIGV